MIVFISCYECLKYHLENRELPACIFSEDIEETFDEDFGTFAKLVKK